MGGPAMSATGQRPCQECGHPLPVQSGPGRPRLRHAECWSAYRKRMYEADPEAVRASRAGQQRAWRAAHPDRYREARRDRDRRYRESHREQRRARDRERLAALRGERAS